MSPDRFFAHSGHQPDRSDWQPLPDHLGNVARLAAERGGRIGLSATAAMAGLLHDFGKYDPAFDRVLQGDRTARVDHSTAGGWLALSHAQPRNRPAAEALAYAVLGHHAGLPDKQDDSAACLTQRIAAFERINPVDPQIASGIAVELDPVARELAGKCPGPQPGFNLSLAVRMAFSCLVDADFRDTEAFYAQLDGLQKPRDWPALADVLPDLIARFDTHMASLPADTVINQRRQRILSHVRAGAAMPPGLFTLTVPTGGGKTLASMGFALDHALRHGHRRIIHAIPYSSITQQTADRFGEIFGDLVLEHHSSVADDGLPAERRDKLRLAMEDWAAPIVVTTNVQLFESLFSARPSRESWLRKSEQPG